VYLSVFASIVFFGISPLFFFASLAVEFVVVLLLFLVHAASARKSTPEKYHRESPLGTYFFVSVLMLFFYKLVLSLFLSDFFFETEMSKLEGVDFFYAYIVFFIHLLFLNFRIETFESLQAKAEVLKENLFYNFVVMWLVSLGGFVLWYFTSQWGILPTMLGVSILRMLAELVGKKYLQLL
jgi:hypothetical protein